MQCRVDVRAAGYQLDGALVVAPQTSVHQGGVSATEIVVHVGPTGEEQVDSGPCEGRGVSSGAGQDKTATAGLGGQTLAGEVGMPEGGEPTAVEHVHVSLVATVQDVPDQLQPAEPGGIVEGGCGRRGTAETNVAGCTFQSGLWGAAVC